MLIDPSAFERLEEILKEQGKIDKFEEDSGKILGRLMITLGDIPNDIKDEILKSNREEDLYIFNCSFDFYDSFLGVALYKKNLELASGIWITEQKDNAEAPSKDWIDFFIKILVENVIQNKDGFRYPIYAFVNNESEMIIVPTL